MCPITLYRRPPAATVCSGIGLNVGQTEEDFAAAGLADAGSLAQFGALPLDTAGVACRLLEQLDREYDLLCQGELTTLEACWKWHVGLLGRPVRAECHDGVYIGRLRELSFGGAEIDRPGGPPLRLQPERIVHLSPL